MRCKYTYKKYMRTMEMPRRKTNFRYAKLRAKSYETWHEKSQFGIMNKLTTKIESLDKAKSSTNSIYKAQNSYECCAIYT